MSRGVALSSRVKIEEKKKVANQGVDPVIQIKMLIKVLKSKILFEKKSLLREKINSRLISMDIRRGRTCVWLERLRICDHQKW